MRQKILASVTPFSWRQKYLRHAGKTYYLKRAPPREKPLKWPGSDTHFMWRSVSSRWRAPGSFRYEGIDVGPSPSALIGPSIKVMG